MCMWSLIARISDDNERPDSDVDSDADLSQSESESDEYSDGYDDILAAEAAAEADVDGPDLVALLHDDLVG